MCLFAEPKNIVAYHSFTFSWIIIFKSFPMEHKRNRRMWFCWIGCVQQRFVSIHFFFYFILFCFNYDFGGVKATQFSVRTIKINLSSKKCIRNLVNYNRIIVTLFGFNTVHGGAFRPMNTVQCVCTPTNSPWWENSNALHTIFQWV